MDIEGTEPGLRCLYLYDQETADIRTLYNAREELRQQVRDFIKWLKARELYRLRKGF